MSDALFSDLSLPIEVLREFVLQDVSPSSLVRWCLVSHELLAIAGPLLYQTVVLRSSEQVFPFLQRLGARYRVSTNEPILLLPYRAIYRLEILDPPPPEELIGLDTGPYANAFDLAVRWPSDESEAAKHT